MIIEPASSWVKAVSLGAVCLLKLKMIRLFCFAFSADAEHFKSMFLYFIKVSGRTNYNIPKLIKMAGGKVFNQPAVLTGDMVMMASGNLKKIGIFS